MSDKPQIKQEPMYLLLREGNIEAFNQKKAAGEGCDLSGCDFRNLDLQGMDAVGLDLSNAYFHQTDLRGIDLRQARLEGASINMAKISGAYFPLELSAEEIKLSVEYGTRMRYR